ncbi:MAG: ABC transporter ATP-binding protein [Tenericutes bacterium]|nr:ABC transporter ATP-binding protein [Bacilli bacterium]NLV90030.1 ABC transporter ATP-binding protein [Mycoplasmatota bacterium]
MKKYIELSNVYRTYKNGKLRNNVLNKVNLVINKGEIIVIIGPSGSGKTTLLNCISGLDKPTKGKIKVGKDIITRFDEKALTKFRRKKLGFIFQTYNLLENLNVKQNIEIGSKLVRNKVDINKIIEIVDLSKHITKNIDELSGGEQQRVSIARALAKKPEIMFCDEPTGALDEDTGKKILRALVDANNEYGTTMIIVTHNPGISKIGDRIIKMNSGSIIEDVNNKRVKPENIVWG